MGDILCRVCGEPWDAYGVRHGDMEPGEAKRFLRGQGCPRCNGKKPEEISEAQDLERLEGFLYSLSDNCE